MKYLAFSMLLVTSNVALANTYTLEYQGTIVAKELYQDIQSFKKVSIDPHLKDCFIQIKFTCICT